MYGDLNTQQRVVIPNQIYVCPGTFSDDGIYGSQAESLCNTGYHICNDSTEAELLNNHQEEDGIV